MAVPWSPWIHSHATRSKPLAATLPQPAVTRHPLPILTRTDAQAHKDINARKISDKWACSRSRRNKASRGLVNIGNSCYQTAALQQLYHLRKFMNWILTHNVRKRGGDVLNPCDPTQRVANECVACVMKNLIGKYWGTGNLTAGTPDALPTHDADMVAMQRIVDAWFPLDLDRRTGLRTYRQQQDAEEFQTLLLQACLSSTDTLQQTDGWQDGYHALFSLEYAETWTCVPKCDTILPVTPGSLLHPVPELGFQSMAVLEDSIEHVGRVIGRKLGADINQAGDLSVICPTCFRINPSVTRHFCIEAAPEILRVALNLSTTTTTGDPKKELNPVGYTQYLDLTEFQRDRGTPLRYRLSSVVHHRGQRYDRGHYVSTVQGYGPHIYYVDDDIVRLENTTFFTSNPQRDPVPASIPADRVGEWKTQNGREAVILMYVRERIVG